MRRRRTMPPRSANRHPGAKPATARNYQAPPIPPTLVAEVINLGAQLRGRVLHKELAALEWRLQPPPGLQLNAGQVVEGIPHPTERHLLLVEKIIPPTQAAVAAALANHALPTAFSAPELEAAQTLPAYRWQKGDGREDWRALPFITIDGEDAKDFDDAVWATPTPTGGHHVRVAIADVAHYLEPGGVLDKLAQTRGNSTYFPGAVVPMLPERLSNDLCSLNPHTDKPVLAAELWLDAKGHLQHYRFCRAVIHSAQRCTYTAIQAQLEGRGNLPPTLHTPVQNLYAAYQALLTQRSARGALSLDLPELEIQLTAAGQIQRVAPRPRLAAHVLIEELMIAANVAAATALSMGCADTRPGQPRRHQAVAPVYRVHAAPSKEKLENLRSILTPLGFTAPPPNGRTAAWAALATRVQQHAAAPTLQRALLQAQMQAQYAPENLGHFGLELPLYTHFTSPIRRYADVLVHRALLALLGPTSATAEAHHTALTSVKLHSLCTHLNLCERRSQQAEWEARDRLMVGWLAPQVGQVFQATVANAAPFGCFVNLGESGAEALLPKWHLEDYVYVGGSNCFRRTRGGKGQLRTGSTVAVRLLQADLAAGRLTVGLAPTTAGAAAPSPPLTPRPKRR